MNNERDVDVYKAALDFWGITEQRLKAIEEFAELMVELAKRDSSVNNLKGIYEELADAEIMLEQMKIYFGQQEVEKRKMFKLERLKALIGMPNKWNGKHHYEDCDNA